MHKIKILHLVKKYKGNYPLLNSMILGLDPDRFEAKVCYLSGRHDGKNTLDSYGKAIYLEKDTGTRTLSFRVITSIAVSQKTFLHDTTIRAEMLLKRKKKL